MTQFPDPLVKPEFIEAARKERDRQVTWSALRGIIIRLFVIVAELIGVALFESSALLLDALASLSDVASSIFLVFCIKLASRPPDKDHPFGHGRYEPLVGLQLGIFLVLIGAGMFIQQTMEVIAPEQEALDSRAWVIPLIAVIALEGCYRIVMHTAKKQHSPALEAEALHYRTDSITSFFAAIALLFAAYLPEWSRVLDHIGAILISGVMILLGVLGARKNLNQLLDRVPDEKFFQRVKDAALNASGVKGTEKTRIQFYGPDAHVDIDVEVEPDLTVEKAHAISQQVRLEIQKAWPAVRDVTVHIEPYYHNDH